ncbi:hypothetical protein JCM3766R1_002020, partial [Sporobolomyces carnicolor]
AKLGIALLPGMSELEFALLLYSKKCQFCDKDRSEEREEQLFLRVRSCLSCFESCTVSDKQLETLFPDLHPVASDCVRFYSDGLPRPLFDESPFFAVGTASGLPLCFLPATSYLRSDLLAVDEQLKALEAKVASHSIQEATRAEQLLTPSEDATMVENEAAVDHLNVLEQFVQEREVWVESEQQASRELAAILHRLEDQDDEKGVEDDEEESE